MKESLLLGLIGDGITASRTPRMHEEEGDAHGIRTLYRILDTEGVRRAEAPLPEMLTAAVRMGFDGLNITHPFKQRVIEHLDAISPEAERIGSVNTVVIAEDGTLTGHNTDMTGFARGFELGLEGADRSRVVQVGTGGAGRAVAFALSGLGVTDLVLADVDPDRARSLADELGGGVRAISMDALEGEITSATGVVNATPMGMKAFPGTAFDTSWLRAEQWVADVVYFPLETQLLAEARAIGCRTLDGSGMAVNQAVAAFDLFSGVPADRDRMRATFLSFDERA